MEIDSSDSSNSGTTHKETLVALQELIEVVAKLRSPDEGCPWDLAQTPQTLIPYIIEEAYEVVHAIQTSDVCEVCEELGDLLLQVVLQSQIATESRQFSLKDVAQGISEKLVRRHPHVFGNLQVESVEEVRQNWEQIKAAEKGKTDPKHEFTDKLSRISQSLPPLIASMKMSRKAAAAGFEWDDISGVWDKFNEELAELKYAIEHEDRARQQAELGDLLFTLVNLARWQDLDPSVALQETNQRFIARLRMMEKMSDRPLSESPIQELDELWQKAKLELATKLKEENI